MVSAEAGSRRLPLELVEVPLGGSWRCPSAGSRLHQFCHLLTHRMVSMR